MVNKHFSLFRLWTVLLNNSTKDTNTVAVSPLIPFEKAPLWVTLPLHLLLTLMSYTLDCLSWVFLVEGFHHASKDVFMVNLCAEKQSKKTRVGVGRKETTTLWFNHLNRKEMFSNLKQTRWHGENEESRMIDKKRVNEIKKDTAAKSHTGAPVCYLLTKVFQMWCSCQLVPHEQQSNHV